MTSTPAVTGGQMAANMGRGINLGQCFENTDKSRSATRVNKLIDAWYAKGFRNLRIPTTWYPGGLSNSCMLDNTTYMSQLKSAVDYAVKKGFIVSINAHHERWLDTSYDGSETYNGPFWKLWQRIATYFNYVPQNQLIFEVRNEPAGVFGQYGTSIAPSNAQAIAFTQRMNRAGYDGIRSVSSTRVIQVSPNGMANISCINLVYPTAASLPGGGKDQYLMVHVHSYDPWHYSGENGSCDCFMNTPDPLASLTADVNARFAKFKAWHDSIGGSTVVGTHLGEYGVGRTVQSKRDMDNIRSYYRLTARAALNAGLAVTVWNDGGWYNVSEVGSDGTVQYVYGFADALLKA